MNETVAVPPFAIGVEGWNLNVKHKNKLILFLYSVALLTVVWKQVVPF